MRHYLLLITYNISAANATGISSVHIRSRVSASFNIENYFDDKSMSVHLIEGVEPLAKKGTPENLR